MRPLIAVTLVSLLGGLLVASAPAMDIPVDTTADAIDANPGDGACATASVPPKCSLRAAITEANLMPGADRVLLPAGTYTLSVAGADEDLCQSGDLDIRETVEISGAGTDATVIDADGIDRVFHTIGLGATGAATIHDLSITGGAATSLTTYKGGGVAAVGGILWLIRVRVYGNSAETGGGVHVDSGGAVIINSTIEGNSSVYVGATNPYGSAILVKESDATLNLDSSTVVGNTGGQNTVSGLAGALVLVRNSTISGNDGTGVRNYNGDLEVINSTIVGNGLDGVSFGSFDGDDTVTIYNTIIADHLQPGYDNCSISSGIFVHAGNLESENSCGFGVDELVNTDPMLGPIAANGGPTFSHRLRPGSPAVDAGADGSPYCRATDQRGAARPVDGDGDGAAHCDIGAIEAGELVFADGFESGDPYQWD